MESLMGTGEDTSNQWPPPSAALPRRVLPVSGEMVWSGLRIHAAFTSTVLPATVSVGVPEAYLPLAVRTGRPI